MLPIIRLPIDADLRGPPPLGATLSSQCLWNARASSRVISAMALSSTTAMNDLIARCLTFSHCFAELRFCQQFHLRRFRCSNVERLADTYLRHLLAAHDRCGNDGRRALSHDSCHALDRLFNRSTRELIGRP